MRFCFFIDRRGIFRAGAVLALMSGAFAFGLFLRGGYSARDIAMWRSIVTTPEPAQCVLCGGGAGTRYHAPALVNLSSGAVGDLRVYDPDPQRPGELSDCQRTGAFSFYRCADIVAARNTNTSTCRASLPRKKEPMDPSYFCRDCRALLAEISTEGYILLDLYDLNCIQAYAIASGREYTIRDYTVLIEEKEGTEGLAITVQGNLPV